MNRFPTSRREDQSISMASILMPGLYLLMILLVSFSLSSCHAIQQLTGGGKSVQINPNAGKTRSDFPNPGGGQQPGGQKQPKAGGGDEYKGRLNGYWKIAFKLDGKDDTYSSSIKLSQKGNRFNGNGTDDHNNKSFVVEQGVVEHGKVFFIKRYDHPSNKDQTPVEYDGTVDLSANPYMSGTFIAVLKGQQLTGQWEAELDSAGSGGSGGQSPPPQQTEQPPPQQASAPPKPDRAPDLSGKWNVGFEYRFKEVSSTMWLEQHGDKLRGHGIDHNTKEKFKIEKGWYAFPRVTIIRKYPMIKVKKHVIPAHTMTFKAEVEWLQEKDYHGPYMRGKTDGGGNWEAQLVR